MTSTILQPLSTGASAGNQLVNHQAIAKVFKSGNSQAVRLPKAYRLDADEVIIEKIGNSMLITPKAKNSAWSERLEQFFSSADLAVPFERGEQLPPQQRDELVF